jgi:hypothetical protein
VVSGAVAEWLRSTEPTPHLSSVDCSIWNVLAGALDNFGEWSFHLAAKRGLLPDVWSEAIEAAEELGL